MSNIPTVIIPGIGQSKVKVYDENGSVTGSVWPIDIDIKSVIDDVKKSLMKMMIFRKDNGFSDKCADVVLKVLEPASVGFDGKPKNNMRAVRYDKPLSELDADEKRFIYKMVPMEALGEEIGEDKLFYFAFNPFGNVTDTAAELDKFIENALEITKAEKVNVIAISLGACVLKAYLRDFAEKKRLEKVVGVVGAFDGTTIAADVFEKKVDLSDPVELVKKLGIGGSRVEAALPLVKTIPEGVLSAVIEKCYAALLDSLGCSTMLWASVPHARLEGALEARKAQTAGIEDEIRSFGEYSARFADEIKKNGIDFYLLSGYNRQLLPFIDSYMTSSDCIIDTASSSLGAKCAAPDERLSGGELLSPDGNCDASTCAFPDTTWFFYDLRHDDIAYHDVALNLVKDIITGGDISFESYPRFNGSRNIKALKYNLIPKAKKLSEEGKSTYELDACLKEYEDMLSCSKVDGPERSEALERRLKEEIKRIAEVQAKNG